MLSCEFCEIFMKTYFVKHLRTAASRYYQANIKMGKSLLVDLIIIKITNKRNAFNSFTNFKITFMIFNYHSLGSPCCFLD